MTFEKARAILILFYNVTGPTAEQIAKFVLYGKI